MRELFGTDGIRGVANTELTATLAHDVGRCGAHVIANMYSKRDRTLKVVVGKDTRLSCDMIESALVAGILSTGAIVIKVGVVPTPAVAFITQRTYADVGVMISASHNPIEDNGIKFFSSDGYKLPDEVEARIEATMFRLSYAGDDLPKPVSTRIGYINEDPEAVEMYAESVIRVFEGDLKGLPVLVDPAFGANYKIGPEVLRALGLDVTSVCDVADGNRINVECGATSPHHVAREVRRYNARLGFAFDGDADRLVLVDSAGNIYDGDDLIYLFARYLKGKERLANDLVVSTVMSNLGLERALNEQGITMLRTQVGDRYVLQEMQRHGACLGGEQSGHLVLMDYSTTGDGLLCAVMFLNVYSEWGDEAFSIMQSLTRLPQRMINVAVANKEELAFNEPIHAAVREVEEALGDNGRILVRPSGTQAAIRVMVESDDKQTAERMARQVADVITAELGE